MDAATASPSAVLTVRDGDQAWEVALSPGGAVIGRSPECDVVLPSERVSRQHARLYRDPFGRWIIEDVGSRHGIWLGDQRVQAQALLPGQVLRVGPYHLSLAEILAAQIGPDPGVVSTVRLNPAPAEVEVVPAARDEPASLSGPQLKELHQFIQRLEGLSDPAALYPEVCRGLLLGPRAAALVLRIPDPPAPLPAAPLVLACQIAGNIPQADQPSPANLHLSRRVLEAVGNTDALILARSVASADAQMTLTVADAVRPRAVLAAAVGQSAGAMRDLLYLDVPLEQVGPDMLEYVQAAVRQVRLVRRYLLLLEAKAQRLALDQQLDFARRIQIRLTPREPPDVPGIQAAFHYQPALWVGGDYCDLWATPDGRLAFAVADVAGKGLPAAMVMASLHAALRAASAFCPGPAQAIDYVNRHLAQHLPDGLFVTLFFGVLDGPSGRLEYVNAGHVPPLLACPGGKALPTGDPPNTVLGVSTDLFVTETHQFSPGSCLLVVTDGITESRSPGDQLLGIDQVQAVIDRAADLSPPRLVEAVTQAAAAFRAGGPPQDDVTVMCLRWLGPPGG